jgi:hypothetical protein
VPQASVVPAPRSHTRMRTWPRSSTCREEYIPFSTPPGNYT